MDFVNLRTFVAVAEEQHLTRAAERIHLNPSSASSHIRAIEDEYGVKLFSRTNRGLELTHAGEALLLSAKELLFGAAEFASHARELGGQLAGPLKVGATSDPLLSRIADIACLVHQLHPAINLQILRRTSAGCRQGLETGELDIGVLIAQPTGAGLKYQKLRSLKYRIAGPASWVDVLRRGDWAELAAMPWITPLNNLAYSRMLDVPFSERGLVRNSIAEADSDPYIRAMLEAGIGLSLVREDYALQAEREGRLAVAKHWEASTDLLLAYPAKRSDDPLIRAFVLAASKIWQIP